jgi:hypothetical protein
MPSRIDPWEGQDATYDLAAHDMWKAWKRIGGKPERVVQWALGWLNQRPESERTRLTLRQEIGALGSTFFGSPAEDWEDFIEKQITKSMEARADYRLAVQKEADRFLSMLSGCVEELLNGSAAQVGPLSVSVYVTRRDRKAGSRGYRKELKPTPLRLTDEAIYKVLQALQACGGLVNRCTECTTLFLAERTNKKYCSIKCQNVVTSRKFREKQKTDRSKRKRKRTASRRRSRDA